MKAFRASRPMQGAAQLHGRGGARGGSYEAKSAVTLRKERAFLDVSDQLSIRSIRAENFCSS